MPLLIDVLIGSAMVKSTSYITRLGRILGSERVVSLPPTVSPTTGATSLPAYVVEITTWKRPLRTDIAFPRPIMLPSPIDIRQSGLFSLQYCSAFSVIWSGVCIVASEKTPPHPLSQLESRAVLLLGGSARGCTESAALKVHFV